MHRFLGLVDARLHRTVRALASQHGQGTVEYVGLVLLIAGVLAAVVAGAGGFNGKAIGQTIVNELKEAITGVGKKG